MLKEPESDEITIVLDPAEPRNGQPCLVVQSILLLPGKYDVWLKPWNDGTIDHPSAWSSWPAAKTDSDRRWVNFFRVGRWDGDGTFFDTWGRDGILEKNLTFGDRNTRFHKPEEAFGAFQKSFLMVLKVDGQSKVPYLLWLPSDWYNEEGKMHIALKRVAAPRD